MPRAYVQALNEKLSRQVAISVKVLQVALENSDQYGLNLEAIFNSKSLALSTAGVFTPTESAGTITMTLLDTKWKDSNSIIQALSTQGKTALVTSTSVTTLNNKVAPVQVTTQENYVKETTIERDNYGSDDSSTSVEMETDTLNYGFTILVKMKIQASGHISRLQSKNYPSFASL